MSPSCRARKRNGLRSPSYACKSNNLVADEMRTQRKPGKKDADGIFPVSVLLQAESDNGLQWDFRILFVGPETILDPEVDSAGSRSNSRIYVFGYFLCSQGCGQTKQNWRWGRLVEAFKCVREIAHFLMVHCRMPGHFGPTKLGR